MKRLLIFSWLFPHLCFQGVVHPLKQDRLDMSRKIHFLGGSVKFGMEMKWRLKIAKPTYNPYCGNNPYDDNNPC